MESKTPIDFVYTDVDGLLVGEHMIERSSFSKSVMQKFGYLEKEFAYKVYEHLYGSDPWADGTIEFISSTTLIQVGKDRGSFWVLIKPSSEPAIATQSLQTILGSLSLMKEEEFPSGPVAPAQYDSILDFYARALRQHCMSLIKGDFSTWVIVLKYHLNWMRREFGSKLPREDYIDLEKYIKSKE